MKKVLFAILAFYNKEKSKDYAGKLDSKKRFVIATYALPNPNLTENIPIFQARNFWPISTGEIPNMRTIRTWIFLFALNSRQILRAFRSEQRIYPAFAVIFTKSKVREAEHRHGVKFMHTVGLAVTEHSSTRQLRARQSAEPLFGITFVAIAIKRAD